MNVLSLCGALLTASASVSSGPLRMENHKSKMENVVQKYQTNAISSNDDLVIGNYYQLNVNYKMSLSDNTLEQLSISIFDNPDIGTNIISIVDYNFFNINNTISLYPPIDFDYAEFTYQRYAGSGTFSLGTFDNANDDEIFAGNLFPTSNGTYYYYLIFQYLSTESGFVVSCYDDTQPVYISAVSDEYNPYLESNERNGNLYNTMYGFFYDIFDTDELNAYSSTIMGVNTSLTSWLAHTVCIVLMMLAVVWLILVIRWIFRVFSGLIKV